MGKIMFCRFILAVCLTSPSVRAFELQNFDWRAGLGVTGLFAYETATHYRVIALGQDGLTYNREFKISAFDKWLPWQTRGELAAREPQDLQAVQNPDGRVELFVLDHRFGEGIFYSVETGPNSNRFSSWERLTPQGQDVWVMKVIQGIGGRITVIAVPKTKIEFMFTSQKAVNVNQWAPWVKVSGPPTLEVPALELISAGLNKDLTLQVFASNRRINIEPEIYSIGEKLPGAGFTLSKWVNHGKPAFHSPPTKIEVSHLKNGRLELFVGVDNTDSAMPAYDRVLFHSYQKKLGSSDLSPWNDLKAVNGFRDFAVTSNRAGLTTLLVSDMKEGFVYQSNASQFVGGWQPWKKVASPPAGKNCYDLFVSTHGGRHGVFCKTAFDSLAFTWIDRE